MKKVTRNYKNNLIIDQVKIWYAQEKGLKIETLDLTNDYKLFQDAIDNEYFKYVLEIDDLSDLTTSILFVDGRRCLGQHNNLHGDVLQEIAPMTYDPDLSRIYATMEEMLKTRLFNEYKQKNSHEKARFIEDLSTRKAILAERVKTDDSLMQHYQADTYAKAMTGYYRCCGMTSEEAELQHQYDLDYKKNDAAIASSNYDVVNVLFEFCMERNQIAERER